MQSPLLNLPILPKGLGNNKDKFNKSAPERRAERARRARQIDGNRAWNESKHHALNGPDGKPDVGMILLFPEDGQIADPEAVMQRLVREHEVFANARTASQLEDYSWETVVGIGRYNYGRNSGYVLVYNTDKQGLGFPGGRVRLGQTPQPRLLIEVDEETALRCKVSGDSPVSKLIIGEDEHIFIAYEIEYTGGVPQARPTKDEPIVAVIFVDEPTLLKACRNDEVIDVGGFGQLPILRSHRRAFLDYIAARDGAKQEVVVNV